MDEQPKQLNPLFLMLALALIFALAAGVFSLHSTPAGIPYSEVLDQFRNEKVSSFLKQAAAPSAITILRKLGFGIKSCSESFTVWNFGK